MDEMPPTTIFYAETGGKTSPFYFALRGIKSALKTTWGARTGWQYKKDGGPPKVYQGTVTWTEIDVETGLPLIRIEGPVQLLEHMTAWQHGRSLAAMAQLTGHSMEMLHVADHNGNLGHVHA